MDLSIVIVNWNTRDLLLNCLESIYTLIRKQTFEVFVVDNASADDSVSMVKANYPQVKIIENDKNLGFAAANNKAFRKMSGKYALLLNSDTILTAGAVDQLHAFMEDNTSAGMACGQLLNEDGSKQNSIANFPTIGALLINETFLRLLFPNKYPSKRRNYLKPLPVDSCIGACVIVRKTAMDIVGLLDESFFFYFEETDWAYRMHQHNFGVFFVPTAKIYHLQGKTATYSAHTRIMFYRSRAIFFKKWYPQKYPLMITAILARLAIDYSLNLVHAILTLGQSPEPRKKLAVYGRIIAWHLKGCP